MAPRRAVVLLFLFVFASLAATTARAAAAPAVQDSAAAVQDSAAAVQDSATPVQDSATAVPASAERRLEALERQLAALQAEVEALRAELAAGAAEREMEPGEEPGTEPGMAAGTEAAAEPVAAEPAAAGWEMGYREGGGGFFLRSPDRRLELRQLGYVQFVGSVFHDDFERADSPGDFSIRRARVDWLADFERYQLFVEFDGGPGSTPGSSDFALVEGKLTADVNAAGTLQVVGGKFVSPFSTENLLSSRSQDTVERYVALNSMFLLPALDVQYGLMLRRYALDRRLEVMAGIFNGNGRANDNLSDDNGDKELQVKLNYRTGARPGALKLGLGFDATREEPQSLELRGLSFTPWVAVPVAGSRRGATADFAWANGPLSFRGEGLYADFADSDATLWGGFVQGARFLRGDAADGVQALLRLETANLDSPLLRGDLGDRLDAVTVGINWFWDHNFRLQVDAVGERYNGFSTLAPGASRVEGDGWKPYLLSELQIKF